MGHNTTTSQPTDIRSMRSLAKMTQVELADSVGCSATLVSFIERGIRRSPEFTSKINKTLCALIQEQDAL